MDSGFLVVRGRVVAIGGTAFPIRSRVAISITGGGATRLRTTVSHRAEWWLRDGDGIDHHFALDWVELPPMRLDHAVSVAVSPDGQVIALANHSTRRRYTFRNCGAHIPLQGGGRFAAWHWLLVGLVGLILTALGVAYGPAAATLVGVTFLICSIVGLRAPHRRYHDAQIHRARIDREVSRAMAGWQAR